MKKLILVVCAVMLSAISYAIEYVIPYMPPASDWDHQGFIRITNLEDSQVLVFVSGTIDGEQITNGASFILEPLATKSFTMANLEYGAPEKGLTNTIGYGSGDWIITVSTSTENVQVNGLYRNPTNGFIGSLHDAVKGTDVMLPTVNPASNPNQVGMIKLINPTDEPISVTIRGMDDDGLVWPYFTDNPPRFNINPHSIRTISSVELEQGSPDFLGYLGDGFGKWRLFLSSDDEFYAMSLIASPDGYLSNVTTQGTDLPPPSSTSLSCENIDGAVVMGDGPRPHYLGFVGSATAEDSIMNPSTLYGGDVFQHSVWSLLEEYGSDWSDYGVLNPDAQHPPILIKDGKFIGYISANTNKIPRILPIFLAGCTAQESEVRSEMVPNP